MICSQLPDNENTKMTNMAEYRMVKVIEKYRFSMPLAWIVALPRAQRESGEYYLTTFTS